MALKIPPSMYSQDQLLVSAEELSSLAAKVEDSKHGAKPKVPALSPETVWLLKALPEARRSDRSELDKLRRELESMAQTAPLVTVVLAAQPSKSLKEELCDWLRQNVAPEILVNFHVNSEIGGGVIIRTANRIYDDSFRSLVLRNAPSFTKVLNNV